MIPYELFQQDPRGMLKRAVDGAGLVCFLKDPVTRLYHSLVEIFALAERLSGVKSHLEYARQEYSFLLYKRIFVYHNLDKNIQ